MQIGETAKNLLELIRKGFAVPKAYIITSAVSDEFKSITYGTEKDLELELGQIIDPEKNYFVCISTDRTDKEKLGTNLLQSTDRGLDAVQNRIRKLHNVNQEAVETRKNSVLLIEVPSFRISGSVFTRNPLNGADETILEITARKLNCDEVQFQQLVFQKGKIVIEAPASLPAELKTFEGIIQAASQIEHVFGTPVFLQWILHEDEPIWITAECLRSMEGLKIYSNKIAKDMLPGVILPLTWSVNTPILSSSWKRLITELTGENRVDIKKMTKSFYYRAYFNMGLFGDFFDLFGMPRETLEIMMLGEAHRGNRPKMKMSMKLFRYLPRLALFVLKNLTIAKRTRAFLVTQKHIIDAYRTEPLNPDNKATWATIGKIIKLNEECSYNVIIVRLIRSFHHTLLRSLLKRKGIDKTIGFDIQALRDIDPNPNLQNLKKKFELMSIEEKRALENGGLSPLQLTREGFAATYAGFIHRFGHMSTSTIDMSKPQWRENPQHVMEMIKNTSLTPASKAETDFQIPSSPLGLMLRTFYNNFVEYEQYSLRLGFLYTYGYSLFRKYFLHMGGVLNSKGYLSDPNDIFYLTSEEIQETMASDTAFMPNDLKSTVEKRKKEILDYSDIDLPTVIYGDMPPPPIRKSSIVGRLKGLPTSRGYYEGRARVIASTEDFAKIQQGDVLVVPYSDASWTPLFAKAGAVISESGGVLSHCSIVAREYGIPAVVAVEGATKIPDNAHLNVDGFTGDVLIKQ